MNKPVLYSSAPKSRFVIAMLGAAAVHLSAVALAAVHRQPPSADPGPAFVDIIGDPNEPEPPTPPEEISSPPPVPDSPVDFTDHEVIVPKTRKNVMPIRQRAVALSPAALSGSAKTLALNAPRPEYPYEARSRRITGTGVVVVTINASSGFVVDAAMSQSTGNSILDNSALSAFRRWRFKPGTAPKIRIPITFTLTGAQL